MSLLHDWVFFHWIELGGTLFGLICVWLSIRQSLLTWPAGILASLLYSGVFFQAKFYAGMGLQFYYLIISVYGWWSWNHSDQKGIKGTQLRVTFTSSVVWLKLFMLNLILTLLMYILLAKYTDSPLPFGDAFTTSLSILATWMLARKKIEHWLIWIFVDLVCAGMYLYRGLVPTVFLFAVYTLMAVIGFFEWRKESGKVICEAKNY
jgi:nicotinamide mononucleotide transporter